MKRILLIALAAVLTLSLFACKESNDAAGDTQSPLDSANCYTTVLEPSAEKTLFVQFQMQGGATFVVELYPRYAPETVSNFQTLVESGFYNGLTFHRIYRGFMIQGGCPEGDGTGFSEKRIKGEFSDNGFTANTLKHERGIISMARQSNDNNSASCQFFIMHDTTPSLDGKYAAFGRVVAGMETVDAIANVEVTLQNYSSEKSKPVTPPVIEKVVFVQYTAQ